MNKLFLLFISFNAFAAIEVVTTLPEFKWVVDQIGKEFKSKQAQLQPLMAELKNVRHEYMEVEAQFAERKSSYDKVAVGLEIEKQNLEKECDTYQVRGEMSSLLMFVLFVCMLFSRVHPTRIASCRNNGLGSPDNDGKVQLYS